jgi:pimeloyl-ACP methyl ester carboxylesterase
MTVRGAGINYEVLGSSGPWVALTPGGRRGLQSGRGLAEHIAQAGYRVLIHDRRNCGASDLVLTGEQPEYEIWADDLADMLKQLGATPAWVGGGSSGARLALTMGLRLPHVVKGLLLYRTTGGPFACKRLANQYYGQYVKLAREGGMAAVAESEHFAGVIKARPAAKDELLRTPVDAFVKAMEHWSRFFLAAEADPVIGATEAQLRGIKLPTVVICGNDVVHPRKASLELARLVPGAQLEQIFPEGPDLDEIPFAEWDAKEAEMARIFVAFMKKHGS